MADSLYEDPWVRLDDEAVTITSNGLINREKRIRYEDIHSVSEFEMGTLSGRHRLVGISVGRPLNWFHWDRERNKKSTAIELDVGRRIRPTITPADPQRVVEIIRGRLP